MPTATQELMAAGYGMTTFGLESHWVPLYTHKALTDKKRGDEAFKAQVADPKRLNNGEMFFLAKKASQGFFSWKPEECLTHKFENVTYVKDKLGGTRVVRSEPYMGCRWCREVAGAVASAAPVETVTAAAAPAAEPPAVPTCDVCGWKSRKGNYLAVHKIKHTRAAAKAAPAQGSA